MARRAAKAMHATLAIGSRGFTLLELLVVLTIMVLIASAWPLASSHMFAAQRLRGESQQLAAAIRVAQMTARLTGSPQEIAISPEGTAYRIASDVHELPAGLTLHVRNGSGDTSDDRFFLFPDGSSSDGLLSLSLAERVATLRVLPATGRLEVNP
jgi:prepilin-type N-terminal cleavage/methylation domain-containing protein